MTLSYRGRVMGGIESEFPAFEMVGSMPVKTWKCTLTRAKGLYVSVSAAKGVNPAHELARETSGYMDMLRALCRVGASAAHALVAGPFHTGRFRQGVTHGCGPGIRLGGRPRG